MRNVVMILLAVLFFGFWSDTAHAANNRFPVPKRNTTIKYKMKKGDTLWGMAKKVYVDGHKYKLLKKVNRIKNEKKIKIGKVIIIPKPKIKALFITVKPAHKVSKKKVKVSKHVASEKKQEDMPTVSKAVEEASLFHNYTGHKIVTVEPKIEEKKANVFANTSTPKTPIVTGTVKADAKNALAQDAKTKEQKPQQSPVAEKSQNTLAFSDQDVMDENDPNIKTYEEYAAVKTPLRTYSPEHDFAFGLMYEANRYENMKGLMVDYLLWLKPAKLDDNFRVGPGLFLGAWKDAMYQEDISGIFPAVSLGLKYNHHTPDHLMRMVTLKGIVGYEFQFASNLDASGNVNMPGNMSNSMNQNAQAVSSALVIPDAMDSGNMGSERKNNLRYGYMAELHWDLTHNSMLGLMSEGWLTNRHVNMAMSPTFSLDLYHKYRFVGSGIDWTVGAGPLWEDWNRTWGLKIAPLTFDFSNMLKIEPYVIVYPWEKNGIYTNIANPTKGGVNAIFTFEQNMHKGHEI